MAEEYRPNLNRLKNKSGDGEDPILVAQRFLNIFRQLHIFDEKRHAEFKAQILALPPEIRNAFNVLPGGQALQEYADEVVREAGGQTFANVGTAPAQGNILSAAMAEATPQAQSQPSSAQTVPPTAPLAMPQVIQAAPGRIVADEAFAQTLAQAFAKALQFSDNNKKEDIKELIAAIRESKNAAAVSAAPIQPQTTTTPVQPAAGSGATESRLVADEEFAQTLARSFAKALQFSDAGKKEDIKELIAAIRESKNAAAVSATPESSVPEKSFVQLTADENFAQMLAQSFTQALETANAGQKGDMKELIEAIKGIRLNAPQPILQPSAAVPGQETAAGSAPQLNIDNNFAQILAQSFASALEMSNAGRKSEMQELIAAIRESAIGRQPVQGGEISAAPSAAATPLQGPMTVIADESFAHTISQSFSNALETFGQNQSAGFKELAEAFRESRSEMRPAAGDDFSAGGNPPSTVKVIADEGFALTIAKSFSSAMIFSDQKRMAEMEKLVQSIRASQPAPAAYGAGEAPAFSNTAPVFNNDNLVKEITAALSSAISSSKTETVELTKAIRDTQSELAKILLQNNTQNNAAAANNNANNIHINNAPIILPIDEIVGKVVEAQSGFLKELSGNQTAELSSVISAALKESQELSSRTIVDAIKAFQEENLKLIRSMPVQVREVRIQETPQTSATPFNSQAAESAVVQEEELSNPDESFVAEPEEKQTETIAETAPVEILEETKKKKKKKKKKKSKQEEDVLPIPSSLPQFSQEKPAEKSSAPESSAYLDVSLFGDTEDEDINSLLPDAADESDTADFAAPDIDNEDIFSDTTEQENAENVFNIEQEDENFDFAPETEENFIAEDVSGDDGISLLPEEETPRTADEPEAPADDVLSSETGTEASSEEGSDEQENAQSKKISRNSLFDDINRSIKNSSKTDFDRYIKSEFESATIEEDEVSSADWGFSSAPEPEQDKPVSEYKGWALESEEDDGLENQDWTWEYEEEPVNTSAVPEGVEGQDWEWEYEEEPAEGVEGQDWEWEYEEVPANAADTTQTDASGQDWEWVYEENYAAFNVYGQDTDLSSPVQLTSGILIEDGKNNSRRNTQKRLVLNPTDKMTLPDEIMIAELQNTGDQPHPYPESADI